MKLKEEAKRNETARLAEALRFVVRLADATAETGGDAFTNLAQAGTEARRALDGSHAGQARRQIWRRLARLFWRTLARDLGLIEAPGRLWSPWCGIRTRRPCVLAHRTVGPYRKPRGAYTWGGVALAWARLCGGYMSGTSWPERAEGQTVEAARLVAAVIRSAVAAVRVPGAIVVAWARPGPSCGACISRTCLLRRPPGLDLAGLRAWTRARVLFWSVALVPHRVRCWHARPRRGRAPWGRRARLAAFGASWGSCFPWVLRAWARIKPHVAGPLASPAAEASALAETAHGALTGPRLAQRYLAWAPWRPDPKRTHPTRRPRQDVQAAAACMALGLWCGALALVRLGRLILSAVGHAIAQAARCPAPAVWGRHGAEDGLVWAPAVVLALCLVAAAIAGIAAVAGALAAEAVQGHALCLAADLCP